MIIATMPDIPKNELILIVKILKGITMFKTLNKTLTLYIVNIPIHNLFTILLINFILSP